MTNTKFPYQTDGISMSFTGAHYAKFLSIPSKQPQRSLRLYKIALKFSCSGDLMFLHIKLVPSY